MAMVRGLVLGALNVIVIGIGLTILTHDGFMAWFVIVWGGIPGAFLGAMLGWLAENVATWSPRPRMALLGVPAVGAVVGLGAAFGMSGSIPVACIPTIVAALILERWTRRAPAAAVPVAAILPTRT
jgi:hypothetical protein